MLHLGHCQVDKRIRLLAQAQGVERRAARVVLVACLQPVRVGGRRLVGLGTELTGGWSTPAANNSPGRNTPTGSRLRMPTCLRACTRQRVSMMPRHAAQVNAAA